MSHLQLGVIGNCQIAALLDDTANVVWACFPQLDADPVFCSLLRSDQSSTQPGCYRIEIDGFSHSEQRYIPNTAIVKTTLFDGDGNAVEITDVVPRYNYMGRTFRPMMISRRIKPLGTPRVRVRLRPASSYGSASCNTTHGSNHIRYVGEEQIVRLTTDLSLTHVLEETSFILDQAYHLVLGPDESIPESISETFHTHYRNTKEYWQAWSRGLSIPFEWQEAVIRAAISLKLCTFEDTGAVIAAITTSVPEAANSGRNWDYRFCWMRDSYFVVQALNRLGATRTMEGYLRYILNVVAEAGGEELKPLYGISGRSITDERIVESLDGYRGMGPVRIGNQAYEQVQHDVYGAAVLASTQYFFDSRLIHQGGETEFRRLEALGAWAEKKFDQPDAGLWEYRGRQRVHTFSSIMCWAACDRLARIADHLKLRDRHQHWRDAAEHIHQVIVEKAWDEGQQAFTESFGRPEMDASLLTMHDLGFLAADDPRFVSTVERIGVALKEGKHLFRYRAADDFGEPENAFNICTFWYIDALAVIGRRDEARDLFENMLASRNPLGLLSEDIDPASNELWGNFPQTYSMAGIISAAMRLSKSWDEAL